MENLTLWGKKVDFMNPKCNFLQLRDDLRIPKLEELTVCLDLWKQIQVQNWCVFMYKKQGREDPQLGLFGEGGNLRVWLSESSWLSSVDLSLQTWHSVCLTWSGPRQRLHLYVNGSVVKLEEEISVPNVPLAPNGTLTLGVSHGFTNGELVPESGHKLPGYMSLFRMWDQEYSHRQLLDLRCAKGDLIRWVVSDWHMHGCKAIPDTGLKCETFPTTPSTPSTYTNASTGPITSYGPLPTFKDSFFRVRLNVNVNNPYQDSEEVIRIWLQETLGKDQMSVLNLEILTEPGACLEESQQMREGFYIWPQTEAQQTATVPCEGDPRQKATRLCCLDGVTEKATWTAPDLLLCPLIVATILDLDNVVVLPSNSMDVVEIIENLTSCHTKLSFTELVIVLGKLAEVVNMSQMTPPLGTAIINVIANIIATDSDLSLVTNEILSITDSIGNKMTFGGDQYNVAAPSLAISLFNVDPGHFQGLSFGVSSVSQDSSPEIFINQDPFDDTVAFISLPHVVGNYLPQQNGTSSRVQFHFYGTMDLFKDSEPKMKLNTYVVSASVTNATIVDLEQPIVVTLHHLEANMLNDEVQCVYWDVNKNDKLGGWESSGCTVNHTIATRTTCFCNHLTHFGVLLDVSRTMVSDVNEEILTIISYLGCGISSIFLGISLLTYVAFEKLRRDYPSKILLNLSLALLGLNLVFLVNSWLSSFNSYGLCIVVAVVQHYTLLASFTWMGLEALHMYFALVKVFNIYVPFYMLKFCVLGWGIPLIIVSLVLIVKMDAYGSILYDNSTQKQNTLDQFCWLKSDVVFYVSVVAYILFILLCNVSVFVVVLVQIRNMREGKAARKRSGLLHDLRGVASLTFLLGLTWMLAFFTWGPAKVALLYLFAILNSLQGFFVFLFHCLMKESVRKQWRIHLCCGRFRLTEHSDLSHTATVGMKFRQYQLTHAPSMKSAKSDHSNSTSSTSCSSHSDRGPGSVSG
ncbi:putative G-protein coupled receptor 112, partial [Scleropages formosus]